jgi:dipeptidyl aminopeptidase/acylaminoacyl peptidase
LNLRIRIVDADGTGDVLVTDQGTADGNPEWSPDDTLILFGSRRDGDSELYTQAVEGGAPKQLTSNDVDDDDPSWSTVANRIAFVTARGGARDIWTMDPDGGALAQLTGDDLPARGARQPGLAEPLIRVPPDPGENLDWPPRHREASPRATWGGRRCAAGGQLGDGAVSTASSGRRSTVVRSCSNQARS